MPQVGARFVEVPATTQRVTLHYDSAERRCERMSGGVPPWSWPELGPMVADLVRYLIAATLTFLTGIVMGYRPHGGVLGVLGAIVLAIFTGWAMAWIFTWVGTLAKSARSVQGFSMMILFPEKDFVRAAKRSVTTSSSA